MEQSKGLSLFSRCLSDLMLIHAMRLLFISISAFCISGVCFRLLAGSFKQMNRTVSRIPPGRGEDEVLRSDGSVLRCAVIDLCWGKQHPCAAGHGKCGQAQCIA